MTISFATLGGLKLNDHIAFKNKIARYEKVKTNFLKYGFKSAEGNKYYFPDYFDDEAWKLTYERNSKQQDGASKFLKTFLNENYLEMIVMIKENPAKKNA